MAIRVVNDWAGSYTRDQISLVNFSDISLFSMGKVEMW